MAILEIAGDLKHELHYELRARGGDRKASRLGRRRGRQLASREQATLGMGASESAQRAVQAQEILKEAGEPPPPPLPLERQGGLCGEALCGARPWVDVEPDHVNGEGADAVARRAPREEGKAGKRNFSAARAGTPLWPAVRGTSASRLPPHPPARPLAWSRSDAVPHAAGQDCAPRLLVR